MRGKQKIGCVVRISPSWWVELMRMRVINEKERNERELEEWIKMRGMKENERNEWEWEEWMRGINEN